MVDDNPSLRALLLDFLRSHGYRAESACDGRQALRLLDRHTFRLVLTDIYMPEGDGIELITHLRKANPKPRIVAMSGDGSPDQDLALNTARLLGARHLLYKPFALSELLSHVQTVLGRVA
ncbi:MAG: response regulator [Verrucomicrobia bacterium]|nr:response regulator [Verrucomicrobiota bacterium]